MYNVVHVFAGGELNMSILTDSMMNLSSFVEFNVTVDWPTFHIHHHAPIEMMTCMMADD